MKFRIYQLFYLIAAALIVQSLCTPFLSEIIQDNGATYSLKSFCLVSPDGSVSYVTCALGVVLVVGIIANIFGILVSAFSNFELQKRTAIFTMLLMAGFYILFTICLLVLSDDETATIDLTNSLHPFLALIFNMIAFYSTRRTEAKILAKATGFRLRD